MHLYYWSKVSTTAFKTIQTTVRERPQKDQNIAQQHWITNTGLWWGSCGKFSSAVSSLWLIFKHRRVSWALSTKSVVLRGFTVYLNLNTAKNSEWEGAKQLCGYCFVLEPPKKVVFVKGSYYFHMNSLKSIYNLHILLIYYKYRISSLCPLFHMLLQLDL